MTYLRYLLGLFLLFPLITYAQLDLTLTITGDGTATSQPAGLDCPEKTCNAKFEQDVTLTATPATNQTFDSWGGDCTGTEATLTLTVATDKEETKNCTATFKQASGGASLPSSEQFLLTLIKTGKGTVASNPIKINCGTTCQGNFGQGGSVTLTATPDADATFKSWGGDCTGSTTSTQLIMDKAKTCTALFETLVRLTQLNFGGAVSDGVDDVDGIAGASGVAVGGENGQHVYVAGFFANAIAVFQRDPQTGGLTFIQTVKNGTNDIKGLQGANALALSPDGKHLYVAGSGDDAVVVFTRNLTNGLLTLVEIQQEGIKGIETLAGASAIAVSPDGTLVYVAAPRDSAITAFQRNANSGVLTYLHSQSVVNGLKSASGVTVSRDNAFVYVAGSGDNSISVFTKELAFIGNYRNGIEVPSGLSGAYSLVTSPDDKNLYVASNTGNSLVAFRRDPALGTLTYLQTFQDGESAVQGLAGARAITINPKGNEVYVAGANDNALVVFSRAAASGLLTFARAFQQDVPQLNGATAVATSPGGEHVYVAALASSAVSWFSASATDLQITMNDIAQTTINSPLTYTLTVTNKGVEAATEVSVSDELPVNTTFVSATPNQGTGCTPDATKNTVTCPLGTLQSNASATITLAVTAPSAVGSGILTNKATVSSSQPDTLISNNTVEKTTLISETLAATSLKVAATTTPLDTVGVNSTLTYTVTVTNEATTSADQVVLTSTLPTGATFLSATPATCTHEAGIVTCQLGSGQSGESTTVDIKVMSPATVGTLTFTTQVSASGIDTTPADNTATVQTAVSTVAQIDVTVMDAVATPDSVNVGDSITLTINVANNGEAKAEAVVLNTVIPVQMNYVSDTAGCTYKDGQLTCQLGTLEEKTSANSTKKIEVKLIATAPTQPPGQPAQSVPITSTLTATGSDTNNDNNSATEDVIITGALADFVVTVADEGNAVLVNTQMTYTITAYNNGPGLAGATVSAVLTGENILINEITVADGTCTSGTTFTCTLNPIEGGKSQAIKVAITPTLKGTVSLRAELATDGHDPTVPNIATAETAVADAKTDLSVTLTSKPQIGATTKELIYTAEIKNAGPSPATGVLFTQTLPLGTTFVSAQGSQGEACTQAENAENKVTCPLGPLNLEKSATVLVTIIPEVPGQLSTQAAVRSQLFDPELANNTAILETQVTNTTTDVSVTVTDSPDPAVVEGELTYTFTVQSSGEDANGVTLTVTLPEQVLWLNTRLVPEKVGTCQNTGNTVNCQFEIIRQSTPATVTVTVQANSAGELTSSATATGQTYDPDEKNNTVTTTTQVNNLSALFFVNSLRNGLNGVQGLEGVTAVAVSPDGQHLYAAGFGSNALAVFKRNAADGSLSFVQALIDGSNQVDGLAGASDVKLSPDGNTLYATGFNDSAVAVFKRDLINGTLTFLAVYRNETNGIIGLSGAYALAVSANHVYVAGLNEDAIAIFSRLADGSLSFNSVQREGSLDAVNALALSPDGLHLYSASANSDSLTVFSRDTTSGQLSPLQTLTTADGAGLDSANGVAVSPDGLQVFATGGADHTVSAFNRDSQTGRLTLATVVRNGEKGIYGLTGASGIAVSPDGSTVYVAAKQDHTVSMFRRQADGLNFIDNLRNGNEGVSGLTGARALALSPSGEYIYVAGFSDNAIGILQVAHADLSVQVRDSADPVKVGDNFTYTVTVTNNGPHRARKVVLTDRLPVGLKTLSYTPSQGDCTQVAGTLECALGSLDKDAVATITVVMTASGLGEMSSTVTASSELFDPSTPNQIVETTQIVATADVNLTISAKPTLVAVDSTLEILATVTNFGPDTTSAVVLTSELPPPLRFKEAQLDGKPTEACQWFIERSTVECTLELLDTSASHVLSLLVEAISEGSTTVNVGVISGAFDPDLSNNKASQTLEITLKVIRETHDNTGQTLKGYIIAPSGAVVGGALEGQIVNQGLISDVWITPDTLVSGGGKLSGQIKNEGIIENAQLLSGTTINGGILRGTISGFAAAPATINATIEAGTKLEHVIIAVGSTVDPVVEIGEGVRFAANSIIPPGLVLTRALPYILEPIGQRKAVNLLFDVVPTADNLLSAINALPDLRLNGLAFVQSLETGGLFITLGTDLITLVPTAVYQRRLEQEIGITVFDDGSVEFVTASGRVVVAQPALQEATALQSVLMKLELAGFTTQASGNLVVAAHDQLYFTARPQHRAPVIESFIPLGLIAVPSPLVQGLEQFILRYVDKDGVRRQQFLYPVTAHLQELKELLAAIPGASSVDFYDDGSVAVKIRERTYTGVFAYEVVPGEARPVAQILTLPDQNGDGSEDVKILYTNGDQQIGYLIPLPDWVAEIQAIPEVRRDGILATTDAQGLLHLLQGDTWRLLRAVSISDPAANRVPKWLNNSDGSALFITESGREIHTLPWVQESERLNGELGNLGLKPVSVDESSGNLWVGTDTPVGFSARPAQESTLAVLTRPLGLNSIPTSLPGVSNVLWVFRDTSGRKRQQFLYPAAVEPQGLVAFLLNIPAVTAVTLHQDGQITVSSQGNVWRGLFAYTVQASGVASGGIQLTAISDQNGDQLADFEVIYSQGAQQIIYQVPD